MQAFDTIKLQVPPDAVRSMRREAFNETIIINGETQREERMWKARHNALPVGVSSISYLDGGDFQVTMSAKTLKDNYLEGINLNTIDQALAAAAPVMDIDPYRVMAGKVYLNDTTNNLLLDQLGGVSQPDICQALLAAKGNDRFLSKWYQSSKKLGVEFHGTQQEKNRLICYSKNLDLLKPQNKAFMASITNPGRMLQLAEKMIRIETNHTAYRSMRQRFRVADNTLQQLLESREPVNHNFLAKVLNIRSGGQISIFDRWQNFDGEGEDFELYIGRQTIIQELGYSDVAVKQFYKELYGDRFKYHWYKKKGAIKDTLTKLKAEATTKDTSQAATLVDLCLKALREAV